MHLYNYIWIVLLVSRLNLAFSPKLSCGIDKVLVCLYPCGFDNPRNTLRLSPAERVCGDASTDWHARARSRPAEAEYKPTTVALVAHWAPSVPISMVSLSSSCIDSHGPRALPSTFCTPTHTPQNLPIRMRIPLEIALGESCYNWHPYACRLFCLA
jgi:hypothetical protein